MTPILLAVALVVGVASETVRGVEGNAGLATSRTMEASQGHMEDMGGAPRDHHAQRRQAGIKPGRTVSLVAPTLIYSAAAGLDYASTRYALDAGARERNPLMQSHARLVGWKAVQVLALTLVDLELQKRGYRNKARVLRITAFVIGAGLAIHNVHVARRMR